MRARGKPVRTIVVAGIAFAERKIVALHTTHCMLAGVRIDWRRQLRLKRQ